ncbi:uncharacterized protein LOC125665288 [Ostrea edulis]|uniref:uncharacterized protein LOC125665288 n=1 Tax=Ostrea edulis TaxID=37623 RepID=UPI0024AF2DA7|nr:uncharacterized protein LOC125665288 [Ostrea edulis]
MARNSTIEKCRQKFDFLLVSEYKGYEDDFEYYDSSGLQTATPSGVDSAFSYQSRQLGCQYWDSNFPSLFSGLGVDATLPKVKRNLPKRKNTGSSPQQRSEKLTQNSPRTITGMSYTEDLKKRNESRWLKIENVVKEKMEQFDDYYAQLVAENEIKRVENERNSHQLHAKLWLEEDKKRKAALEGSTYDRIWKHHALMRHRGEEEWKRKQAKKNQIQHDSVDVSSDVDAIT